LVLELDQVVGVPPGALDEIFLLRRQAEPPQSVHRRVAVAVHGQLALEGVVMAAIAGGCIRPDRGGQAVAAFGKLLRQVEHLPPRFIGSSFDGPVVARHQPRGDRQRRQQGDGDGGALAASLDSHWRCSRWLRCGFVAPAPAILKSRWVVKPLRFAAPSARLARLMKELGESRVLIVDDAKTNIDILVDALRHDYKLSVALSGEGALQSIERNPPDLVLLDILMPGIDGYEVCRRLRASPKTREIPVMFLSSLEEVEKKTLGFEVGANDYVTKPFELLEVKARVRSLLKAKAYSEAVQEKIASELRIAREIQLGILPSDIASSTAGTGIEIATFLEPAREVGGDLYEVLRTDDGRLVVVIGDVSGKGIPAALFMAVTMTLVRSLGLRYREPDEIVFHVSEALARQNSREMFVTLFCAVIDPARGEAVCASAGHPSLARVRPGSTPSLPVAPTGGLAGIEPGLRVSRSSIDLLPGDTLVLYTDGVTEAMSESDELFGDERLLAQLAAEPGRGPAETVSGLVGAVRRFVGKREPSDDIAILALRRRE
jgi:sigma-B regulation protein RsbU (phosphoserine phosphatase)